MRYRAGNEILLEVETRDVKTTGASLANPLGGVKITLIDPNGNVILNESAMTNVSTGMYRTSYQTTGASPLGVWVAFYKAVDGSTVVLTLNMVVFELVAS